MRIGHQTTITQDTFLSKYARILCSVMP